MVGREELLIKYCQYLERSRDCLVKAMAFRELYDEELVDAPSIGDKINSEITRGKEYLKEAMKYLHEAAEAI